MVKRLIGHLSLMREFHVKFLGRKFEMKSLIKSTIVGAVASSLMAGAAFAGDLVRRAT